MTTAPKAWAPRPNGTDKIVAAPNINSAADLKGKKVAVLEGGLAEIYMAM